MKVILVCLMLSLLLMTPAIAKDFTTWERMSAPDLGPNFYVVNIKVRRGPLGNGFLGTDNGWILMQQVGNEAKVIASGNGRFDGTNLLAAIGGAAVFGGLETAAAAIANTGVDVANNVITSANATAKAKANASAKATGIGIGIGGGWIPPGQRKHHKFDD